MGGRNSTQQRLITSEKSTLDVAVTGMVGGGKSSLVNALRGLSDYDEEAAKTGMVQTTVEPKGYPHPTFPDVIIWDLPGFGTPQFKPEEYLEWVNLSQYDFFIIVACHRFTLNETQLCQAIQKMGKQFYFVWSKMDYSICTEKRKPKFSEEAILQTTRNYCLDNLVKAGISSPKIFLISIWSLEKYDFPLLQMSLENDIDILRKRILRPAVLQESEKGNHDRLAYKKTVF